MLIWGNLLIMKCIHVFGGTSSPGCCNHALQRTALNNVSSYSEEATNKLLRNVYMDDALKSIPSIRDAPTLIQEVGDICKGGGFKLTKFISKKSINKNLPFCKIKISPQHVLVNFSVLKIKCLLNLRSNAVYKF